MNEQLTKNSEKYLLYPKTLVLGKKSFFHIPLGHSLILNTELAARAWVFSGSLIVGGGDYFIVGYS